MTIADTIARTKASHDQEMSRLIEAMQDNREAFLELAGLINSGDVEAVRDLPDKLLAIVARMAAMTLVSANFLIYERLTGEEPDQS